MHSATVKWRLSPLCRLMAISPTRSMVITELSATIMNIDDSRLLGALAEPRSEAWIAAALGPSALGRLGTLRDRRLVVRENAGLAEPEYAHALAAGWSPRALWLDWLPLTDIGRRELAAVFTNAGTTISNNAPILLVTTDDYLHPELSTIAESETRPWLLARPAGRELLVGPFFGDSFSTCWHCLAHWMRPRRWTQSAALAGSPPQPALAASAVSVALASGLIATLALQRAAGVTASRPPATILALDSEDLSLRSVAVPARVRCHCSGPRRVPGVPTQWTNDVTGMAFAVEHNDATSGHSHHASCLHVYPGSQREPRRPASPGSAFGQGETAQDALDTCLAEALERYSACWQGTEPMAVAKFDANTHLHPDAILQFSDEQYEARMAWNRSAATRFQVPPRFNAQVPAHWSPVRRLSDGALRFAPTSLCYGGFVDDRQSFGAGDSVGCGGGRTNTEAVLSALLEKVEREALAIWWYNRVSRPQLDVAEVEDTVLHRLLAEARIHGLDVEVLDLTHDLGIPVYVAIGSNGQGREPFFGAAAHPRALVAARKAIAEMLQMRFWSHQAEPDPTIADWLRSASLATDPYLVGAGVVGLRRDHVGDAPSWLEFTVRQLAEAGLDAYVVDLTRPEAGLPVARVVVPNLRHCWHRLAPGRLYSVPFSLGWVRQPLAETALNPRPCPL